jgi:hypothetical protein
MVYAFYAASLLSKSSDGSVDSHMLSDEVLPAVYALSVISAYELLIGLS